MVTFGIDEVPYGALIVVAFLALCERLDGFVQHYMLLRYSVLINQFSFTHVHLIVFGSV